jgi:hypothetical protein
MTRAQWLFAASVASSQLSADGRNLRIPLFLWLKAKALSR